MSIEDIRNDSDTDDEFTQNNLLHLSQDSNVSPVKTPKPSKTSSAKPKSVKQLNQRLMKSNLVHLWPRTYDLSLQRKIKEDDAEFIKYERDFIRQLHHLFNEVRETEASLIEALRVTPCYYVRGRTLLTCSIQRHAKWRRPLFVDCLV